jgi:hypothetical protein
VRLGVFFLGKGRGLMWEVPTGEKTGHDRQDAFVRDRGISRQHDDDLGRWCIHDGPFLRYL